MKKRTGILFLTITTALIVSAKPTHQNVLDIKKCIVDSAIVYPESFEIDTQKLLEGWYMRNYTASDDRYRIDSDKEVSDEELIRRLSNMPTIIEMPFNQIVKSYIKRYTEKGRAQVSAILGLSYYYMPIFEQALEAQGLPLELKYLPVIESGLDPNAVSRSGATGLWQFLLGTARGLGMEVNSLVDERRDPYISSEKAAAYLKDLYDAYGDWLLAIAAYNCGPGNVNKAIRRAGGESDKQDYWSIYNYLSPETRGYVPMFIAANYVMTYHSEHNINPVLATKPLVTDTVGVASRLHFNQISEVLNIPVDELRILNPQYRADIIPATSERQYFVTLPSQQIHAYILSEKQIMEYNAEKYARRDVVEPKELSQSEDLFAEIKESDNKISQLADEEVTTEVDIAAEADLAFVKSRAASKNKSVSGKRTAVISHKVVAGESLASIAKKYDVTPEEIKEWNNLRRNAVRTGQQLRIMTFDIENEPKVSTVSRSVQEQKTSIVTNIKNTSQQSKKPKTIVHTVKNGESLTRIATKYGVTVNELRTANGIKGDKIHPGDKLKVPSKKSSGSKTGFSSSSTKKSSTASKSKGKKSKKRTHKKHR